MVFSSDSMLCCFDAGSFHDELLVFSGCMREKRKSAYSVSEAAFQVCCTSLFSFPLVWASAASLRCVNAEFMVFMIFCGCIILESFKWKGR